MQIKKKLIVMIHPTPPDHDSDDVIWKDLDTGEICGSGYQSKETKKLHVIRCPMCNTENYALNVPTGTCYKCGFDANYDNREEKK